MEHSKVMTTSSSVEDGREALLRVHCFQVREGRRERRQERRQQGRRVQRLGRRGLRHEVLLFDTSSGAFFNVKNPLDLALINRVMLFVFFTDFFFNVLPGFGVKRLELFQRGSSAFSSQGSGGVCRQERQRGSRCFPLIGDWRRRTWGTQRDQVLRVHVLHGLS